MSATDYGLLIDADMSSNVTSVQVNAKLTTALCLHLVWTGSPVGTLTIQASANPARLGWSRIPASRISINGAGDVIYNISKYPYLRVFYERVSGTGVLNANLEPVL